MQPRHPFPSLAILSSFLSVITNWWVYECSLDVTCSAVCNAIIITSPALSRPVVRTQVLHVQYSTVHHNNRVQYSIYKTPSTHLLYTSTRLYILHIHAPTHLHITFTHRHQTAVHKHTYTPLVASPPSVKTCLVLQPAEQPTD